VSGATGVHSIERILLRCIPVHELLHPCVQLVLLFLVVDFLCICIYNFRLRYMQAAIISDYGRESKFRQFSFPLGPVLLHDGVPQSRDECLEVFQAIKRMLRGDPAAGLRVPAKTQHKDRCNQTINQLYDTQRLYPTALTVLENAAQTLRPCSLPPRWSPAAGTAA
jgi:hypothetical protein